MQVIQVILQSFQHFLYRVGISVIERSVGGQSRSDLIQVSITLVVFLHVLRVLLFHKLSDVSWLSYETIGLNDFLLIVRDDLYRK